MARRRSRALRPKATTGGWRAATWRGRKARSSEHGTTRSSKSNLPTRRVTLPGARLRRLFGLAKRTPSSSAYVGTSRPRGCSKNPQAELLTASFSDVDPHRIGYVWWTHREIDATGSDFADLRTGHYQRNTLSERRLGEVRRAILLGALVNRGYSSPGIHPFS